MPMNEDSLWRRLMELGPFASEDEARRAFDATLRALRRGLNEDEADWLAVALGPALSAPLLRESYAGPLPRAELYRWMKRYTKTRKGIAVEHAQVVCQVLAELLPSADLERLQRHLPELASLFTVPDPDAPPPPRRVRAESAERTRAGARHGSPGPLSGAAEPDEGELAGDDPERAQGHSVARARDPHGDTQIASSRGLTQEREGRTLASTGHGGHAGHGGAGH